MKSTINELEKRYTELNNQLCHKLNSILWLDKVEKLQKEPEDVINAEYERIAKSIPTKLKFTNDETDSTLALARQLRDQLNIIQTDSYLNDLLQVTLPILRAIHHETSDLTSLEQKIATNLNLLYGNDSEDGANVYNTMKMFQQAESNDGSMIRNRQKLVHYLIDTVKPRLLEYDRVSKRDQEVAQMALERKNQQIDEFVGQLSSDEIETIDIMYSDLVKSWLKSAIYCDLLPGIVLTLPLDWHSDPNLAAVVNDCLNIGAIMTKNQSLVNVDTIKNITSEKLISYVGALQ